MIFRGESQFLPAKVNATRPVPSGNSGLGVRERMERLLENVVVLPTHVTPDHLPAEIIRTPPDAFPQLVIVEQFANRLGQTVDVTDFYEYPTTVPQHFLSVPVGRRHDRLATGHSIG